MNKRVLKELGRYSATAIALIGIQKEGDAQVVYTNIRDTLLSQDQDIHVIFLDLNNDGHIDFRFKAGKVNDAYISAGGTGNSMIASTVTESSHPVMYPIRLDYLHPIDALQEWGKHAFGLLAMGTSGGDSKFDAVDDLPFTTTDGYLGVRFKIGADQHYGWIRMDCDEDAKWLRIKDFAYNAKAGAPINAGQTSDECQDIFEPNNKTNEATPIQANTEYKGLIKKSDDKDFYKFEIKADAPSMQVSLYNLQKNYNLLLLDAKGKKLGKSTNKETQNEVIVLNNAAPGQYFAVVTLKGNSALNSDHCYSIMVKTGTEPFVLTPKN